MKDAGKRIIKVLNYIHHHLDEPLPLPRLAAQAHVSAHHFHRLFSTWCGMGLATYVRQQRICKAANALVFRQHQQVLDIALANGFNSAEAFTRTFQNVTGRAPSAFRSEPDWQVISRLSDTLAQIEKGYMNNAEQEVELVELSPVPIAIWLHQGPPHMLGKSLQAFIQWRKQNGFSPKTHRTFNLIYDDPSVTPPNEYRFGLASEVSERDEVDAPQMTKGALPGGLCAHIPHIGPDHLLESKVAYLYSTWIHSQPYELRDEPMVFERLRLYPDVPATEAMTDIYLPVEAPSGDKSGNR